MGHSFTNTDTSSYLPSTFHINQIEAFNTLFLRFIDIYYTKKPIPMSNKTLLCLIFVLGISNYVIVF